jgi:hypothetical protein
MDTAHLWRTQSLSGENETSPPPENARQTKKLVSRSDFAVVTTLA